MQAWLSPKRLKQPLTAIANTLQLLIFLFYMPSVQAENQEEAFAEKVRMIETEDATCIVNDGKLISLSLVDTSLKLDVWVDRWFMEVQTADHTKQQLSADTPIVDLGCSRSAAGPQRWTIHSIKAN